MQDTHDERRIPLELEPADAGLLAWVRRQLSRGREKRTERETQQQITIIRNRPLRHADARRAVRTPGQHPDIVEKGLRILGRVGRGSA